MTNIYHYMKTNEEVIEKDDEKEVEVENIVETQDDDGNDTTDWKVIALEKQEFAKKNHGIAKRYKTKFNKLKDKTEDKDKVDSKTKPPSKSDELDYGQKAFLIANGIKGSKENDLVKDIMSNTGKTLDEIMESKYFQSELKEMRDLKQTEDAVPKGSKRTGQSAKSQVEYWLAKGELPPASEPKLRQDVVNARIKTEKDKNVFTDNPVIR